jgi:hypothetical protein
LGQALLQEANGLREANGINQDAIFRKLDKSV